MFKYKKVHLLLLATIFCSPAYLFKASFFGIPTNYLEILILLSVVLAFSRLALFNLRVNFPEAKWLVFGAFLIIFGLSFSASINENILKEIGILKSWFVLPMIFSVILFINLKSGLKITSVFKSIYFSTFFISLLSLGYRFFNITTYDNRLSGPYNSPNYLAMFIAPGLFLGFYFLHSALQTKTLKAILINTLFLASIIVALYFTFSYGAWLAISLALFFTFFLLLPRKILLIATGILMLTLFTVFTLQKKSPKYLSMVSFSERSSVASRIMIWDSSFLMLKNNPVFGIGPGNFQATYLSLQPYFPPYLEWAVPHPHNLYLAFWLQAGLLGLTGFLAVLLSAFKSLFSVLEHKKSAALAAPILAYLFFISIHGLIDTPYWKNDLALIFWILISIIIFLKNPSAKPTSKKHTY